jgi:predicted transcriptional regulator
MTKAQVEGAKVLANYHELIVQTWGMSMSFERLRLLGLILDGVNTTPELHNDIGFTRSAISRGILYLVNLGAITVEDAEHGRTLTPTGKTVMFAENAASIFSGTLNLPKMHDPSEYKRQGKDTGR